MKTFEVIGNIDIIRYIETLRSDLVTYNPKTNMAITHQKDKLQEFCDTLTEYKFLFVEKSPLKFRVNFEYLDELGEWVISYNSCETLKEARFKIDAIKIRKDMRNPVLIQVR